MPETTTKTKGRAVKPKSTAAELREFLVESLKDIYWAEKALVKALPKMSKNASSQKLSIGLDAHLKETEGHVERLEKVFDILGETLKEEKKADETLSNAAYNDIDLEATPSEEE